MKVSDHEYNKRYCSQCLKDMDLRHMSHMSPFQTGTLVVIRVCLFIF